MISCRLADFICETDFDDLPESTVHMAKLAFLDWLGSTAAGGRQAPFQKALAVLREQGGAPDARRCEKTSCLNAALGNGLASVLWNSTTHRRPSSTPARRHMAALAWRK